MNFRAIFLQPLTDPNKKKSSSGDNLLELDGLRGIALIIVLASHSAAFGMYGQGSLGVLLFFFLSGFVLTVPFANDPQKLQSPDQIFKFVINRALRIVPIYWVACLLITLGTGQAASWFFYNTSFLKGWNHLWSVAEEVRFYLLFPFIIIGVSFLKNKLYQIIIVILAIYLFYENKNFHKIDMMDGRHVGFYFWMFLGGVLTCFVHSWSAVHRILNIIFIKRLMLATSFFVLIFILFSSDHLIKTFWRPLIPELPEKFGMNGWKMPGVWFFLFFSLMLSGTYYKNTWLNYMLNSYFLRHIGLLSYSLYLFHMNIMFYLQKLGFRNEGLFFAVFGLTYIVAYLSYIIIEKPFLNLKHHIKFSSYGNRSAKIAPK